jgi:hypothetical protein
VREFLTNLKAALRETFRPTWTHDDETDADADTSARTAWVRERMHKRGGDEP